MTSSGTVTADTINAPTGRTASYFIAASDATTLEKAQADYVCTGTSSLSATIANGVAGIVSAPGAWTSNTSKTVTTVGDFTVTLAAGQVAIVTPGTAKLGLVLNANANAAQKDITVDDFDGLRPGDQVTIGDDAASETNYIVDINDGTITMLNALGNNYTTAANAYVTPREFNLVAGANTINVKTLGTIYISGMGDESVIQTAIDILSADNGGDVVLSTGDFRLCNTIDLFPSDHHVGLRGQGPYSTGLIMDAWSNCSGIEIEYRTGVSASRIPYMSGFRLSMGGYTGALGIASVVNPSQNSFAVVTPNNPAQSQGDGIFYYFTDSGTGVGHDCMFENILVGSAYRDGWRIEGGWGVHVNNCYSEFCVRDGFYFYGSACYFDQIFSSYNGRYSWLIGNADSARAFACTHNEFHGLTCYTNSSAATSLGGGINIWYSTVSYNKFSNIDIYGYWYYNAGTAHAISEYGNYDTWSNVYIGGFSSARTDKGMNFAGTYNTVTNLVVRNVNTYAVTMTSTNNSITGGVFYGQTAVNYVGANNRIRNVTGYIDPGEIKQYPVTLVAGAMNAFTFAWQNPLAQSVTVTELMADITGVSTGVSVMDAGSAANATTHSDDLLNDVALNAVAITVSTARVKLAANGGASDYITGQILNAAADDAYAGKVYITIMGQ
jgi:hypothetical protein